MASETMYTQQQLDIAILQNTNTGILATLHRLEAKIESNFHWTLGLILGLYTIGTGYLISALGKAYGWF